MNTALSRQLLRAALVFMLSIGCASVALAAKPALVQEQANLAANIVSGGLSIASNLATPSPLYTVPNGSVFVLETVSIGAYEDTVTTMRLLAIAAGSSPSSPFLAFSPQPINTLASATASFGTYSVTARFPPGTTLSLLYLTNNPAGPTTGSVALSYFGHLEPQ